MEHLSNWENFKNGGLVSDYMGVSCLDINRFYHRECFEELFGVIPASSLRHRLTWQHFHSHHIYVYSAVVGHNFALLTKLSTSHSKTADWAVVSALPPGDHSAHLPLIHKKTNRQRWYQGLIKNRWTCIVPFQLRLLKSPKTDNVLSLLWCYGCPWISHH